jgi:chloramphenicol O-acetyltransferase type B
MIERILWCTWKRFVLQRDLAGFRASYRSFASTAVRFSEGNRLHGTASVADATLGRYTYIASGAVVHRAEVGAFCSIGPDAHVGGLGRHPTRWLSTHPIFFSTKGQVAKSFVDTDCFDEFVPTRVGNDVWVGARALILDGVTIGDGAIVAAGAVVARNVEPYSVVAGVPARPIKARYTSERVEILKRLRWWEWDMSQLNAAAPLFREDGDVQVEKLMLLAREIESRG